MKRTSRGSKPPLRTRCLRTLALCAALYLLAGLGCASFQRRLIYFPPRFTPAQAQEQAAADRLERWKGPSGNAVGWKRLSPTRPVEGQVLIMHGNADCACQCGHYADVLQQTAALDVFMVEYPGYADCPGAPSERALDESASVALQLLDTNSPVYLVGESLGTGVAAYLAGRYPERVAGIALLAPYNSLVDVAQGHIRIFPVRWLLCDRFPAGDNLRNFHGPVAVLLAGGDTVVPPKYGRRLYDGYAGPKRLWEFSDRSHDSLMFQTASVWKEVVSFWASPLH